MKLNQQDLEAKHQTAQHAAKLVELSLEMVRLEGAVFLESNPDGDRRDLAECAARDVRLWGAEIYEHAVGILQDVDVQRIQAEADRARDPRPGYAK